MLITRCKSHCTSGPSFFGARRRVRAWSKSVRLILWAPWLSAPTFFILIAAMEIETDFDSYGVWRQPQYKDSRAYCSSGDTLVPRCWKIHRCVWVCCSALYLWVWVCPLNSVRSLMSRDERMVALPMLSFSSTRTVCVHLSVLHTHCTSPWTGS